MRIKMLTQISGTRNGRKWPPAGTVIDLPDGEATQLIATRSATTHLGAEITEDTSREATAAALHTAAAGVAAQSYVGAPDQHDRDEPGDPDMPHPEQRQAPDGAENPEARVPGPETREDKGAAEIPEEKTTKPATRTGKGA